MHNWQLVVQAFGAAVFEVVGLGAAVADAKEIWGDSQAEVTFGVGAADSVKRREAFSFTKVRGVRRGR